MSQKNRHNDLTDTAENTEVLERNLTELLARAHEPPTMDPDARARILANLKSRVADEQSAPKQRSRGETSSGKQKTGRWHWGWAVGGAGLLAVAGLLLFLRSPTSQPTPRVSHDNTEVQPERIALDDGSEVILRSGAAVTVTGPRSVRVDRGEVLFDVAKADQPFAVTTPHGKVVVLGTRFVVEAATDKTLAAVVRGVVRIENQHGKKTLRAGDQGALEPGSEPTRRAAPRLSHLLGWTKQARRQEQDTPEKPIRKGALIARNPQWQVVDYPLPLRDFTVDVHVEGGAARVAVDQTFFNAQPMQLEGVYRFPLPANAAISRLTMYVDGKRMESAVVERTRARRIYESIVYRRRDPALLEWMSGNEFKMRVFPLPGRQEKRIALSYTQRLQRLYDDTRIEVPIPEVDGPVDNVRYNIRLVDCARCEVHSTSHEIEESLDGDDRIVKFARTGYELGDDLVLLVREPRPESADSAKDIPALIAQFDRRGQRYLQVRTQPLRAQTDTSKLADKSIVADNQANPRSWYVLFDTSGSRSPRERNAQRFFIDRVLDELDEDDYVDILAFDATVRPWSSTGVRVGDVDRRDIARFLREQSADGVGHTDLGLALSQVLALAEKRSAQPAEPQRLAGPAHLANSGLPDSLPNILYVGDGVVTALAGDSGTVSQSLLATIAGKAVFVAAAIGDHIDAPLLRTLADGTGGMFSVINPGDDLSWRAFDLIAAFRTARVVGVEVAFLDKDRQPIEEMVAYPSARTIADGEEFDVITSYSIIDSRGVLGKPPIRTPAWLQIRGVSGDSPWLAEIPVSVAKLRDKAGYLQRIWAKRRLDALLADGSETHEKEITRLGKRNFLMTPFTSLLVLENDAMYERYKVSRKRAPGWAEYDLPGRIKVVREPMGTGIVASVDRETLLVRTPRQLLQAVNNAWYYGYDANGLSHLGGTGWGTIGTGRFGTIGHGGGGAITGAALDAFSGDGSSIHAKEEKAANDEPRASMADATALENEREDNDDQFAFKNAEVSTAELRKQPLSWSGTMNSRPVGGMAKGPAQPMSPVRSQRQDPVLGLGVGYGRGSGRFRRRWAGESYHQYYNGNGLTPMAMHYDSDWRLDDLTEHIPGLFQTSIDHSLRALRTASGGGSQRGSITDDARALLARANARASAMQGFARLSGDDGRRLAIDSTGRFALEQTLPTGLVEQMFYTGEWLYHLYPELGVATRRPADDAQAVLYDHFLPFRLPEPEKLARFYHVAVRAGRVLELRAHPDQATPRVDITLDERQRVVEVRTVRADGSDTIARTIEYDGDRIVIKEGQGQLVLRSATSNAEESLLPLSSIAESAWTLVEMPLRQPAYHTDRLPQPNPQDAATDATSTDSSTTRPAPGSQAWRQRMRQLLASQAALQQGSNAWKTLTDIRAHVDGLTRGELALASGGVRYAGTNAALAKLVTDRDDRVGKYLSAAHRFRRTYALKSFDGLTRNADSDPASQRSLISLLAEYRGTLSAISRTGNAAARKRLSAFVARHADSPLAYIATYTFSNRWQWGARKSTVAAWDALAAGAWSDIARFEGARVLSYGGDYDQAAERYEELLADAQGLRIDGTVATAFRNSSRGQAGWRRFWLSWRNRMLASNEPARYVQVLRAALETGERNDLEMLVARVTRLPLTDPEQAEQLADILRASGRESAALTVLKPWLTEEASAKLSDEAALSIYAKASQIAERQGRFLDAAELSERAMERRNEVELTALRVHYAWLMSLYIRAAQTQTGAQRTAVVTRALTAVSEWRALDPDHPDIDKLAAELLYAMDRAGEAWRYLSTIIERRPMEGTSYLLAAQVLENAGDTERAERLWQRAIAVDPTNPTWILRRAEALSALARPAEAQTLLRDLLKRKWHERFWNIDNQARRLEKSLKRSMAKRTSERP